MAEDLITLATFPTPSEAGFFRSLLESEGIPSYLSDDATVGIHPLLGNTIGWVKLQVAERDVDRAIDLLESRKVGATEMSPEEFTAEALEEPAETPEPEAPHEPDADDVPEDPLERLAVRAFRSSVIGFAFFPVMIYAVWLLGRLIFSKGDWSPKTSRNAWQAAALVLVMAGVVWLLYTFRPLSQQPVREPEGWRTEEWDYSEPDADEWGTRE